jgi:hypothetical protein
MARGMHAMEPAEPARRPLPGSEPSPNPPGWMPGAREEVAAPPPAVAGAACGEGADGREAGAAADEDVAPVGAQAAAAADEDVAATAEGLGVTAAGDGAAPAANDLAADGRALAADAQDADAGADEPPLGPHEAATAAGIEATGAQNAGPPVAGVGSATLAAPTPPDPDGPRADPAAERTGAAEEGDVRAAAGTAAASALEPEGEAAAAGATVDGVAPARPEGPMVPLSTVAATLGLSPYTLRSLLDEYADVVAPERMADGQPGLGAEAMARLRVIAAGHAQGLSGDEVRHRLLDGDQPLGPDALLDRLEQLQAELAQSERRRVEDRDRLLLALMRTQQEIQHLRFELAGTRRSRRKGFWARLFGRG